MGLFKPPTDVSEHPAPPEVYNLRIYLLAISAAFASAMFGYDSAFIGGTLSLPSFIRDFGLTAAAKTALSANIVSTFQGGCFFGALFVYPILIKFGRKPVLLLAGVIFLVGSIIQTVSDGRVSMMYAGRVFCGLGVGSSSLTVPLYISECSPPAIRGRLIGLFECMLQTWQIIGFWINFGVNANISATSSMQWRIPVALQVAPASLLIIAMLFQPESPRFLIERGRIEDARKVLSKIRGLPIDHEYISYEIAKVEEQLRNELVLTNGSHSFVSKFKVIGHKSNLKRLGIGMALMMFQNFSVINSLNYFSPTIVRSIGFTGTSVGLLATGIYGIVKAAVTFIYMIWGVERLGRRNALLLGSCGASFALFFLAGYAGVSGSFRQTPPRDGGAYVAILMLYVFAVFYAFSWNGIPWIFCGEAFPGGIRAICTVITTMTQWLGQFIIVYSTPYMIANITYGTFILFGTSVVIAGIFVYFFVPETKGLALEEMDILFSIPGRASKARAEALRIIAEGRAPPVGSLEAQQKASYNHSEDVKGDVTPQKSLV